MGENCLYIVFREFVDYFVCVCGGGGGGGGRGYPIARATSYCLLPDTF